MDVQFQLKLPYSGWDYFPLPSVASTVEQPGLLFDINFQLPAFVARLFGVDVTQTCYELPSESPFVTEARSLIEAGHFSLCEEGVGGTYFINNPDGSIKAIFKPSDEEPGSPNNPKNVIKNPILPPGGGSMRELAAYFMDRQNFAGVPPTFFMYGVRSKGFATEDDKFGSLQAFVENDGESSSFGSNAFSTEDVHHIGTLDIRMFNMDRNGENMLVRKQDGQFRLIPIDHTYCLPPVTSLDGAFFEWQYWTQAKKPFSQETRDYVASIDIEQDVQLLRSLRISEESIATMVVSTMLLKEAVSAGWTLFDIACVMSRGVPLTNPSKFEALLSSCASNTKEGVPSLSPAFLQTYSEALKSFVIPKAEQS